MSAYEIEKNVRIPVAPKAGRPSIYPFGDMAVGDSFFVNGGKNPKTVAQATYNAQRKTGRKFTIRRINNGVRVWRVA